MNVSPFSSAPSRAQIPTQSELSQDNAPAGSFTPPQPTQLPAGLYDPLPRINVGVAEDSPFRKWKRIMSVWMTALFALGFLSWVIYEFCMTAGNDVLAMGVGLILLFFVALFVRNRGLKG